MCDYATICSFYFQCIKIVFKFMLVQNFFVNICVYVFSYMCSKDVLNSHILRIEFPCKNVHDGRHQHNTKLFSKVIIPMYTHINNL